MNTSQQKSILGGQTCAIKCNSGAWIHNAPDHSTSAQNQACANQGGPSGSWQCTGMQ